MYIYSAFITLKNGHRIYAKNFGKKAFRFWIDDIDNKIELDKRY